MRIEDEILNERLRKIMAENEEKYMANRKKSTPTIKETSTSMYTKRPAGRPSNDRKEAEGYILDIFTAGLDLKIQERVESVAASTLEEMQNTLLPLIDEASRNRTLEVHSDLGKHDLKGKQHQSFEKLLKIAGVRLPAMLVGPAGSGKTHASEQVAQAFGLPYYSISVGAQTSKSDVIGYMNATGGYVGTQFRDAYENGGVFLMDEIDAGNSNVLIVINAALSGSQCAFPDAMVTKHKDFIFIATANTYGMGANRMYVGRNQLDAATLDRFTVVDWPVDEVLEESFVAHLKHGKKWHRVVTSVRELVSTAEYRLVISPRATIRGATLLEIGLTFDEVVGTVLCTHAPEDQKARITETANSAWR